MDRTLNPSNAFVKTTERYVDSATFARLGTIWLRPASFSVTVVANMRRMIRGIV
jgi:hypothetical protein